jgi:hypothetical protein
MMAAYATSRRRLMETAAHSLDVKPAARQEREPASWSRLKDDTAFAAPQSLHHNISALSYEEVSWESWTFVGS